MELKYKTWKQYNTILRTGIKYLFGIIIDFKCFYLWLLRILLQNIPETSNCISSLWEVFRYHLYELGRPSNHYFILVKGCCYGWGLMTSSAHKVQGQFFKSVLCEWLLVGWVWRTLVWAYPHDTSCQSTKFAFLELFGTVGFPRIERVISQYRQ